MDFLRKLFFKDTATETTDTIPEQSTTVSIDHQEDTSASVQSTPLSVNLMGKFLRTQRSSLKEPPETLHENEAWAPEMEFVGLFRKRRF